MATKVVAKTCTGNSRACFNSLKDLIQRLSSTKAPSKADEEIRVSFVTNGCSFEELEQIQDLVSTDLEVHEDFITQEEESVLMEEIEPYLKRLPYEYDHWDDAIHGYREVEKSSWTPENMLIFKRTKDLAFQHRQKLLTHAHVLDLARNGYIKPHIDSVKFCGAIIAGLSLLSSSVMRFKHKDNSTVNVDVLLNPRSLYILRDRIRYDFTHEILSEKESVWKNTEIPRDRRISVLLRCEPQ